MAQSGSREVVLGIRPTASRGGPLRSGRKAPLRARHISHRASPATQGLLLSTTSAGHDLTRRGCRTICSGSASPLRGMRPRSVFTLRPPESTARPQVRASAGGRFSPPLNPLRPGSPGPAPPRHPGSGPEPRRRSQTTLGPPRPTAPAPACPGSPISSGHPR